MSSSVTAIARLNQRRATQGRGRVGAVANVRAGNPGLPAADLSVLQADQAAITAAQAGVTAANAALAADDGSNAGVTAGLQAQVAAANQILAGAKAKLAADSTPGVLPGTTPAPASFGMPWWGWAAAGVAGVVLVVSFVATEKEKRRYTY